MTFDDELAFVWKKNWSIGSTLFVSALSISYPDYFH